MELIYPIVVKALIAIGIGALVGLEREHHSEDAFVIAGARTYPLVSLFGFIVSILSWYSDYKAPYLYLIHVGLIVVSVLALMMIYMRFREGHYGLTSSMAFIIVYIIGVLVGIGDNILNLYTVIGVFAGVVTTYFLLEKRRIHSMAESLSSDEIISAAEFVLVLLVILPLALSIEGSVTEYEIIGPGLIIDPIWILSIVIFVSIISFVSFLIIRMYGGQRGLLFMGLAGGFVSSEVATAALANAVKEDEELLNPGKVGIYMSMISLMGRNLILCAVVAPIFSFLSVLGGVFAILIGIIVLFAFLELERGKKKKVFKMDLSSPFAVRPAAKFAGVFAIISALVTLLTEAFGDFGLLSISIGGIVSSSAVAASVSRQFATGIGTIPLVSMVIVISVALAMLNKLVITYFIHKPLYEEIKYKVLTFAGITLAVSVLPFVFYT